MGYIIRSLTIRVYFHSAKSREIPRAFELIAVAGHPILVSIKSAYATSY